MMFNGNMMLVVVMLWTGCLPLASGKTNMLRKFWGKPVCDEYELPENAEWVPRDNCEDNKRYTCKPGYQSQVETTCNKRGKWNLELLCQEILCEGEPVIAANSSLDGNIVSRRAGTIYAFKCDPGFVNEAGKVVCDESGNWNVDAVECIENPCKNGGTLLPDGSCDCTIEFTGPTCEDVNPCKNGGTLLDGGDCDCTNEFIGDTCENVNPCKNGGTLLDGGDCDCTIEFIGETCESPQNCEKVDANYQCTDNDDSCPTELIVPNNLYCADGAKICCNNRGGAGR